MAFERLPIIENAAIIRNILYGGVWNKYELVRQKRLEGSVNNEPVSNIRNII